jgi:hypothetical protein
VSSSTPHNFFAFLLSFTRLRCHSIKKWWTPPVRASAIYHSPPRRSSGLDPGPDRSLVSLVHGLRALDVPFHISAAELATPTTTAIQIGTPAPPFAIRYQGQYERFSKHLSDIEAPFAIRASHNRSIGVKHLSPERLQDLHFNDTRLRYPAFFQAVERAYVESLAGSQQALTSSEQLRTDRNMAAAERVSEYVNQFNNRRNDLAPVALRVQKQDGEPAILSAGAPGHSPLDYIVLVRRSVLGEFGEFLKGEFFRR